MHVAQGLPFMLWKRRSTITDTAWLRPAGADCVNVERNAQWRSNLSHDVAHDMIR